MKEVSAAAIPLCELRIWKDTINCPYRSFCPYTLRLHIHLVFEHLLHQAMDQERFALRITMHKRILEQFSDGGIEPGWVGRNRLKRRTQFGCAFSEQFFGDRIRSKKGTET